MLVPSRVGRSGPSLCQVGEPAHAGCPLSELECLCGALGPFGEGGVLVPGGLFRERSLRRALNE